MKPTSLPRPTPIESVIAAVLLAGSLVELTGPAESSTPPAIRLVVGTLVPLVVAFSRTAPIAAAAVLTAAWLLDSFPGPAEGTIGAGFSMLAITFGLAAWTARPWAMLAVVLAAGTVRDLRMWQGDGTDMVIDWAFLVVCTLAGRAVHRRSARADQLQGQLELSKDERERHAAEAVTHERSVIARELHDIVAHSVSLMVVQAGTARPLAERTDTELAGVLGTIEQAGRSALDELRRLLAVLRDGDPDELEPLPDLTALPGLVTRVRDAGLDVTFSEEEGIELPASVGLCAYRVVQEGLTNALRHTEGGRTTVRIRSLRDGVEVAVLTTGGRPTGYAGGTGTGLVGLTERVAISGGSLLVGPSADGWELIATLPFEPDGAVK